MKRINKPFTKEWTIDITRQKMLACIDHSLRVVASRVEEFEGDSQKSVELVSTICELTRMRKALENEILFTNKSKQEDEDEFTTNT